MIDRSLASTFNRRGFIGAAGLSALAVSAPGRVLGQTAARRRMIVRVDDVGMSKVCNIGTFTAIDGGIPSAADIMLDSPGTEDALERLRAYPWLSVGWHTHMWGAPVLPAAEVPSLVERGGQFDGRFRTDLSRSPDVVYEEAVRELRAQLLRCARILGRMPDTGGNNNPTTPWTRAMRTVLDDYGIPYNYSATEPTGAAYLKRIKDARARGEEWAKYYSDTPQPGVKALPRWADRKIVTPASAEAFRDLLTDSVSSVEKNYDPVLFYTEDRSGILTYPMDVVTWQAWHPGYVDYYTYRLGERVNRARAQQFVVGRAQDVAALTDPRLRAWIREHKIELINFRDALYGSHEFQNHLLASGSDLAVAG
ncbi:ChbG/HpnK family deacetylase [Novosphingobium flavum]|uniref:ChbG/HpnK family deacetylase n=1 Tax=Novosphingobium flavum TaxID=1778672 RepID=A0A7X1FQU8_9SPHN|nr:ChbG/HpnK family deacetylase [Novosphingobium flavum]MBC2665286.1 ChbG/HpnK family deacetylase [Novosphingobium flavum]